MEKHSFRIVSGEWFEKLLISSEKILMLVEIKSESHDSYIFWTFFREGITVPNFIIVGYVWQTLGRGAFLLPHTWAATKMAILNRIKPLDYWICYKLHSKSALHCKCLYLFFWTTGNILIPTKFYRSLAISPLIVKF